jgi:gamma-glutamyl-gamma-aminobutyrate hydrolase PuuD
VLRFDGDNGATHRPIPGPLVEPRTRPPRRGTIAACVDRSSASRRTSRTRRGASGTSRPSAPHAYVRHVTDAGGVPVVVPPDVGAGARPRRPARRLVLAGGADLDPALRRGAEAAHRRHPRDRDAVRPRCWRPLERDLPVLGVCRAWSC